MALTQVIIVMAAVAVPVLILLGWEGYKEAEYGGGTLPTASDHVVHPSTEHLTAWSRWPSSTRDEPPCPAQLPCPTRT